MWGERGDAREGAEKGMGGEAAAGRSSQLRAQVRGLTSNGVALQARRERCSAPAGPAQPWTAAIIFPRTLAKQCP